VTVHKALREGFVSDDDLDTGRDVLEFGAGAGANEPERPIIEHEHRAKRSDADAPPPFDPDAAPKEETWPVIIKLMHKPTRNTKNEVIHELRFRAPTAGDIFKHGNPVRIDRNNDVITEPQIMLPMLAELAGVYEPMMRALDGRDYNSVWFYMQRFFLPNSAGWPIQS
jgi:Phage tail assembly chaperone proteins, E, or 41 or 14